MDDVFEGNLSKLLNKILKDRNTGTAIIEPDIKNSKFDKDFLVKLSTGVAYLGGLPNFDSMTDKYYARFYIKHSEEFFNKMQSMEGVRLPGEKRHKKRLDKNPRKINKELIEKIKSLSS